MAKKPKKPKNRVITAEQFSRWSPEHQQRALADKRIRQRIETRALPAEWQARRKQNQWNRTPITEGSSTTYGDLEQQRKYLEPLTFGEGDRQLANRAQNLATLQQASNDWFTQYRQQVADANARASDTARATIEGGQNMITGITNQSNADRDAVAAQLRDRAAQLGQVSQVPEFAQVANAARDTRAAQLASSNQAMNAGAAADSQIAAGRVLSAGAADLENRATNRRREDALNQDKSDYAGKKDAWRAKFIDDAISEARKQVLEDRVFQMNAADKAADNKLAAAKLKSDQAIARAKLLIDQKKLDQAAVELGLSRQELQAKIDAGYFDKSKPKSKPDGPGFESRKPQKRFTMAISGLNNATYKAGEDEWQVTPERLISRSVQGAKRGVSLPGGATWAISNLVTQSKGALSRKLAARAVYTYIAYGGRVPNGLTYSNAPKSLAEARRIRSKRR